MLDRLGQSLDSFGHGPAHVRGLKITVRQVSNGTDGWHWIAAALKKAATELGVPIHWGGRSHGFKDMDRSHRELGLP
jgi:hypothetical protein